MTERLTAFSDGVVAIAITLLALELPVPDAGTNAEVSRQIAEKRLTIVVTPFATRMLTADGAFEVRFITYAAVQALCGVFLGQMLGEVARHKLESRTLRPAGWPARAGGWP